MIKWFLAVVLSVFTAIADFSACSFTDGSQYNAVCQITVGGGQGSGTLIALDGERALVLTCRHVAMTGGAGVKLEWLGAACQRTSGKVITVVPGTTFNNDLALVVSDAPKGLTPVIVAKFDEANGPWRCVGWRGGQMYEAVADEASEADGLIKFNSPLIGGQSGGAMLDKNGHLVGVSVGSDMTTYGVAADGRFLAGLLDAYTK